MKDIKVSVIIPTYKRSEDICRAVDSVLNQTLDSFEVIVVDDNGIDTDEGKKTSQVMSKYADDTRVVYIQHESNKNGSAARNTGIRASRGKYISFLDDDDTYLPERLSKMVSRMESLDDTWGACYTGYVKYQRNGKIQYSAEKVEGEIFLQTLMRSFYLGSGSNMFFRKSTIDKVGLFDESFRRNQDLEYLVRVTKQFKMAFVDEVLMECFYDIRTTQLDLKQSKERELNFRKKFSPYLKELSLRDRKSVVAMWDIDWVRLMIATKKYFLATEELIKRRIPLKALIGYISYVLDRKKNNTCYGYKVRL